MRFVNLTRWHIAIRDGEDHEKWMRLEPIYRPQLEYIYANWQMLGRWQSEMVSCYGVEGVPEPKEGVAYIVESDIMHAIQPARDDIVTPDMRYAEEHLDEVGEQWLYIGGFLRGWNV